MTTVADVRGAGSTIVTASTPIPEPLAAQEIFGNKLARFGDNYNVSNTSHLYRFLVALCGESGAGSVKKELLTSKLQQMLESTHFTNLDRLYGDALALPRLSEEVYGIDPLNEILTQDQWSEVKAADAAYRERCLLWMRAVIEGPSVRGMALAGEAALGVECDVVERYKYLENLISDTPTTLSNIGETNSRNEFVIVPRMPNITEQEKRRVLKLVNKLRPVNVIVSVFDGDYLRNEQFITNVASSSDRFNVRRLVTGRTDVNWPALNPSSGYWIQSNIEAEAPTYAFMDRQESVTYISIQGVSASSYHTGAFNQNQALTFSHLSSAPSNLYVFSPSKSFAKNIAPISLSIPFVGTSEAPRSQIIVNNYYPVGYFAQENASQFVNQSTEEFWASVERDAPAQETLSFDLGVTRAFNFIDFEICQKPINFTIEYSTDQTNWTAVEPLEEFPTTLAMPFLPSLENPWGYFEYHFTLVQARYFRVVFTRRQERFPLPTSDYFPWSIEVRNLRILHTIPNVDLFVEDQGKDILGNAFRTDLQVFASDNVTDGDTSTFWQSQPNPSPSAVEALYFDLRTDLHAGTMSYLDTQTISTLDTRSMSDWESYYDSGVVIDEIYVDPITFGPNMHIYYSLDDTPDWDEKLWIPIARNYTLKRGFHGLPTSTYVKYVKLEFSHLAAAPYQPVEYPSMPPVTFRRFPSWVQDYFNKVFIIEPLPDVITVFDRITIDPLTFGFQKIVDQMSSTFEDNRALIESNSDSEVKGFIDQFLTTRESSGVQETSEDAVRVRTPVMWQSDLLQQLDTTHALARIAQVPRDGIDDTGFTAELGLPIFPPPVLQSGVNLEPAWKEKKKPSMFFPQRCRHGYQIVSAPFTAKIAYFVALREVSFHRRDFTIAHDETMYVESLGDDSHVEVNDFRQQDWRFVV